MPQHYTEESPVDGCQCAHCVDLRWNRLAAPEGALKPGQVVMVDGPPAAWAGVLKIEQAAVLPSEPTARKAIPVGSGVLDYFPAALAEIAKVSKAGNDQHNPGQPLHWARGKSMDHWDTIVRHGMERGTVDTDGQRHSAKMAWRALALLQQELEDAGAPISRGSK